MIIELASMGCLLKGRFFILGGGGGLEGLGFLGCFVLGLTLCWELVILYCRGFLDSVKFLLILLVHLEYCTR